MNGTVGWALVGAVVTAWDTFAPESLSAAFDRAPTAVKVTAAGVTLAHLFGVLPDALDPFSWASWAIRRGPFRHAVTVAD